MNKEIVVVPGDDGVDCPNYQRVVREVEASTRKPVTVRRDARGRTLLNACVATGQVVVPPGPRPPLLVVVKEEDDGILLTLLAKEGVSLERFTEFAKS